MPIVLTNSEQLNCQVNIPAAITISGNLPAGRARHGCKQSPNAVFVTQKLRGRDDEKGGVAGRARHACRQPPNAAFGKH